MVKQISLNCLSIYMANNNSSSGGGIGFTGMLTILFIGLKLAGVISWPWVWVLSPLWITLILAFVVITILLLVSK